jgi:hypothetical protein
MIFIDHRRDAVFTTNGIDFVLHEHAARYKRQFDALIHQDVPTALRHLAEIFPARDQDVPPIPLGIPGSN